MKCDIEDLWRVALRILSDAASALRGINAREDVDAATLARVFLPFEAAKIEGIEYGGAVVSLWGIFDKIEDADGCEELRLEEFIAHYRMAWGDAAARLRFSDELRAAMFDALAAWHDDVNGALAGALGAHIDYPAHEYAERVRRFREALSDALHVDAVRDCGTRVASRCARVLIPDDLTKDDAVYLKWIHFKDGAASDFTDEAGRNVRKVGQRRTIKEFYEIHKSKPLSDEFQNYLSTYFPSKKACENAIKRVEKRLSRARNSVK